MAMHTMLINKPPDPGKGFLNKIIISCSNLKVSNYIKMKTTGEDHSVEGKRVINYRSTK